MVIVIYTVWFCKFPAHLKLIVSSVLFSTITVITVYFTQFAYMLGNEKNSFAVSGVIVGVNLLNLVNAFFLSRYTLTRFRDIPVACSALILLNIAVVVICVFAGEFLRTLVFNLAETRSAILAYTSMWGVVLYVMTIVTYFMMYVICLKYEQVSELRMEKRMAEADEEILRITKKNLDDIRGIRHDIKNSYAYMSVLLENGQYEDLKKYLGDSGETLAAVSFIDCGNRCVMNILNMEKAKLEASGFRLTAELNVPAVLPFKDVDLCSVLSNLVDNAMEACERMGEKDAEIVVRITLRQEYLYIGVSNRVPKDTDKEELLKLKTNKNGVGHGYGTKIVKRISEKDNGYVVYSVENGLFIAEVMFDVMGGG